MAQSLYTALFIPLLLAGCSSLPTEVQGTPSYVIEDTLGTSLARDLRPSLSQHPEKSGFHTLLDGLEAYATRVRLIRAAERSIDVQYYIWHTDLTGKTLYGELLAAAERGVRVRILLDDLDTAGKDELLHIMDAHPGVEFRLFNPFANRERRAADFITDTARVNRRMHNKTFTVDNQATVFGGRNIGDEYFDAAEDVGFSDMDVLAVGPVVSEVSASFDLYWNSRWVYPLAAFEPEFPVSDEQVNALVAELGKYLDGAHSSSYAAALRELDVSNIDTSADIAFVWSEWLLAYDQPGKVEAKTVSAATHLAPTLKAGMDKTERELLIVSPYFVPGKAFADYLVALAVSGVRVRIMTNSLAANDVKLVHAGYMRYRKLLLRGGVELYEFKSRKADATGERSGDSGWAGSSSASLHGKFFAFDMQYMFIGSFNLDARSTALNTELGVYFKSPAHAKRLSAAFDEQATIIGYQVLLDDHGKLLWITRENGEEVRLHKEPDTSGWTRFITGFLSIFVPESQL